MGGACSTLLQILLRDAFAQLPISLALPRTVASESAGVRRDGAKGECRRVISIVCIRESSVIDAKVVMI